MSSVWPWLTRLGEAQLLLPLMVLAVLWLLSRPGQARTALAWLLAVVLAASVTTASKVAFIGYGWGLQALDFTGFSGHAMFAAAVLPPLLRLALGGAASRLAVAGAAPDRSLGEGRNRVPMRLNLGVAAGYLMAAAVAVSRVQVSAHSWSEVLSGFALGAVASGVVLATGRWPQRALGPVVPLLLAAAMAWGVAQAPASRTHDWVTRLALASSGRAEPYQRWLHRHRAGASLAAPPALRPSLQPSLQPR